MKKITISFLIAAVAIAVVGCAKQAASGVNDANKRYFDAWMEVNHPDLQPTGLGIYIFPKEEVSGTGAEVKKDGFVQLDYIVSDLQGNITSYTGKETAEQLGDYNVANYYGPKFQTTMEGSIPAGLADALIGMKVGARRKVIIPTWLMSYSVYDSAEDYLNASSSTASAIYDITVRDYTENITEWQIGKIGGYFDENRQIFGEMTVADSLKDFRGFYYKQLIAPKDTVSFPKDTAIYINYTGRLLDGSVFDTTDEKLAKDSGIWSSSRTYEPVKINWGEDFTGITMGSGSSSVIAGFSLTLWQMREFEKGIGVFTSDYGYGYSGSGNSIPGFAPLTFEIEIVPKP